MSDIIDKLQDMINEDIYCIFDNGDEYLVTVYGFEKVYIIDKELMTVRLSTVYEPEAAYAITNAKMLYCAEPNKDVDLFDQD